MDKILEILKKLIGVLQVGGEVIAKVVEIIGKIISALGGLFKPVAKGVRRVFGIKK